MNIVPLPPGTPEGWHADPSDPTLLRYWNGNGWTEYTAPVETSQVAGIGDPTPAGLVDHLASVDRANGVAPERLADRPSATGLAVPPAPPAPPPPAASPASPASPAPAASAGGFATALGWWAGLRKPAKVTILVVAAVIVLSIMGSIGRAFGGGEAEAEPQPSRTPTIATAARPDATYVIRTATRDLDDYAKDIDDMIVTLDENGVWRLLTNYGELSFNLGQLKGLTVTSNIEAEWGEALLVLEQQTDAIGDDVGDKHYDTLRVDLDAAKNQTVVLKEIVSRAVTD